MAGQEQLTLTEAQSLIQVIKRILKQGAFTLPSAGKDCRVELCSIFSDNDRFIVILNRKGRIRLDKYSLLLRFGKDKMLLRIDVGGPAHDNPDGSRVECPHIHYKRDEESRWDAWAFSLPAVFGDAEDRLETFKTFLQYCNVNNLDEVQIYEQAEMR